MPKPDRGQDCPDGSQVKAVGKQWVNIRGIDIDGGFATSAPFVASQAAPANKRGTEWSSRPHAQARATENWSTSATTVLAHYTIPETPATPIRPRAFVISCALKIQVSWSQNSKAKGQVVVAPVVIVVQAHS